MKKLNITIDTGCNFLLSYAYPLSILLSKKEYYNWYMQNYIEHFFCIDKEYNIDTGIFDALEYGELDRINSGLIEYKSKSYQDFNVNINIIDTIITFLNNDTYCVIFLDEYYLSKNNYFGMKNEHFSHEYLIYGYDLSKKEFNVVCFENLIYCKSQLSMSKVKEAFKSSINIICNREPIWKSKIFMTFKIKNTIGNFPFQPNLLCQKLYNYFIGIDNPEMAFYKKWDDTQKEYATYGIETSRGFSKLIDFQMQNKDEKYFIINIFDLYKTLHLLYQHRLGIYNRILYLENYKLNNNEPINQMPAYKKVVNKSNSIRLNFLKYMSKIKDKQNIKVTMFELSSALTELYQLEKNVFNPNIFKLL